MNQEQIREKLLQIRDTDEFFTVILSGKKSRKVNGLYKPEKREIVLHNRNFTTEHELVYTALHEYAHHLQFSTPPLPGSARTHTTRPDTARTRNAGGVGLGLYLCREIIRAHDGKIWVDETYKEGSRICISLPREV